MPVKTPNVRCTAHSKSRDGGQCGNWAIHGGTVCRYHGGAAPRVKAKAAERLIDAAVARAAETYGLPVTTTPDQALLDEVHRTAGHIAWLRAKIADVSDDDLVWGRTRDKTGGEDRGITHEAKPNAWLELYHRERAHLVRVCAEAIKAGIEERRVRLAEAQGALVADVIRAILTDLDLTPEQTAKAGEVVPMRLRAVAAS